MEKTQHELKCECGAVLAKISLPTDLDPAVVARRLAKRGRCAECAGQKFAARAAAAGKSAKLPDRGEKREKPAVRPKKVKE